MDMKADVDSLKYDDVAMESHVHHHVPSHHEFDAIDVDHKHNMMDGSRDSSNGHNMHNMQMHTNTFSLLTESDFLIEDVSIACVGGIILAMIFTIVITVSHDVLKVVLHQWELRQGDLKDKTTQKRKEKVNHFVRAIVHLMSVTLAYLTMLCVMTMNVWLFISVVFGSGIAHLLIRPILISKLHQNTGGIIKNEVVVEGEDLLHEDSNEDNGYPLTDCCQTVPIVTAALLNNDTKNV